MCENIYEIDSSHAIHWWKQIDFELLEKEKTVNRINLVQFIQFARNTSYVLFFSLKRIHKEPNKWLNVHLFTIEAEKRETNNHNVIDL